MTHGTRPHDRRVPVSGLARVEGEGGLHVHVRDGSVTDVALDIFEPPRFFESLLRGRRFDEAPDITARICGICPVAYQMSACAAMEDVCRVEVPERVGALRRLLYCGEWIQSHALHITLLHAPDFLGVADAVAMAETDPEALRRGLRLRRMGNRIMEVVGGRAVHPVNVRVGGFHRAPDPADIASLAEPLRRALDDAMDTLAWVSAFDVPDVHAPYRFVALSAPDRYPIEAGRVVSSDGLDLEPAEFAARVSQEQVAHSTALHARLDGRPYLTGPLARYALAHDRLVGPAADAARSAGLGPVVTNPFRSIVVRAVELVYACDEALRLVTAYQPPDPPAVDVVPRAGVGVGVTEAPRGLLLHRYVLDPAGRIAEAQIVPPTAQNQLVIEEDLRRMVVGGPELDPTELQERCERAVRNHDPCISCAAHFLDVTVEHP